MLHLDLAHSVSKIDSIFFNQIKGKTMDIFFKK